MSSSLNLDVEHCDVTITNWELGLNRDVYTKKLLHSRIKARMDRSGWTTFVSGHTINGGLSLQDLVDAFSERSAPGATTNLEAYFSGRLSPGRTVGGRSATSTTMHYLRRELRPSERDIGAIGEGIAGYYLENVEENLEFEARPFEVSPDLIFRNLTTGQTILSEVKTSLQKWNTKMISEAIKLLDILAKTRFIRSGSYVAYLIAVKIVGSGNFELRRLKLEEV